MCLGVPGQIIEIQPDLGAVADIDGNQVTISVALLPEVEIGIMCLSMLVLPWK